MKSFVALLLCLPLIAACSRSSSTDAPEQRAPGTATSTEAPTPASRAAPVASAPTLPASAPGAAYFHTHSGIAYILADGTTGLLKGRFSKLARGANGKAYAVMEVDGGTTAIAELDGAKTKAAVKSGSVGDLLIARDGTLHVSNGAKVASYDGKTWTESDAGVDSLDGLGIDADGALWAFGFGKSAMRSGATWTTAESLQLSARSGMLGSHFVFSTYDAIEEYRGGKLVKFGPTIGPVVTGLSVSPGGLAVVFQEDKETRKSTTWLVDASGAATSKDVNVRDAMLDDAGRAWLVADGVLAVTPLLAGAKTEYALSTLPALEDFAASSRVAHDIVVLGAGPSLPAPAAARTATSVKGVVVVGGKPAANTKLEICVEPWSLTRGASPCSEKPSRKQTTTNEKGEFAFADVPIARYDLAMEVDGKWSIDISSPVEHLPAGKTKDVGTIRYSK